jgi:hypothetical protein
VSPLEVKFLIQLKLEPDVLNELEHVRVRIPFQNRTPIKSFVGAATTGEVEISEDGQSLLWNIGAKP